MKKYFLFLLISLLLLTGCSSKSNKESNSNLNKDDSNVISNSSFDKSKVGSNKVNLYLFYSSTCPHCHSEIEWLDSIKEKYSYLNIVKLEATENFEFYEKVIEQLKINDYHVPLTIIGSEYIIGYSEDLSKSIINLAEKYSTFKSCDAVDTIKNSGKLDECLSINKKG